MARRRDNRSPKREIYYIVCIIAALIVLVFGVLGPGGYRDLRKNRLVLQEQHIQVDRIERDNKSRRQAIYKMKTDLHTQEKKAREKNYAREGEIIQRIAKDQDASPNKPADSK
jgi:cell division protein FtsB